MLGPESWVKNYTVIIPVARSILEAGKVAKIINLKPIDHFQAAIDGLNDYSAGDISKLERTLVTKLLLQRTEGARKIKEPDAAMQKLVEEYAGETEEVQEKTGVQTRVGLTAVEQKMEDAKAKYEELRKELDRTGNKLKKLEAESDFISLSNWLLFV